MTLRKASLTILLAILCGFALASVTPADEACKTEKTGKPAAITAKEAWDLASARAMKWHPDAKVFELGTLSTGPLDDAGRSIEWNIKFRSDSGNAVDLISISKGNISCWADSGASGRVIDFDDKVILDSKLLYDTAQKAGGTKFPAPKYHVNATLNQNPIGGAVWYLNYETADYKQGLSVVISAKTGKVTNVFD